MTCSGILFINFKRIFTTFSSYCYFIVDVEQVNASLEVPLQRYKVLDRKNVEQKILPKLMFTGFNLSNDNSYLVICFFLTIRGHIKDNMRFFQIFKIRKF